MAYKQISPQSVAEGGTGASTLTDHGVLLGSGTSAITAAAVGTNGQLLIGSTGADPAFATATSSDSLLTLTGGAGSLDIVAQNAVAASAALTDNLVVRGDGGSRGVQTSTVSISDNGEMTNSSQPCFSAYVSSTITNVTGDGTSYTVIFDSEVTDVGSDYDNTSGIFTAPVTGNYLFTVSVGLDGLTSSSHTQGIIQIITSVKYARIMQGDVGVYAANTGAGAAAWSGSLIMPLTASDTVHIIVIVYGSTKDVDILGSASGLTTFCGTLLS